MSNHFIYTTDIENNIYENTFNKNTFSLLDMNRLDPDFVEIKQKKNGKRVKLIGCFCSGQQGSCIRNAVTGIKDYSNKVGSFNEDLYFKVNFALGINSPNPLILFFDNPKEFETHFSTTLTTCVKDNWDEKYNNRYRILSS